jgi:hypothetical protein
MRRAPLLLAAALLALLAVPARAGANSCTDSTGPQRYATASYGGYVAFPSKTPTSLVVFFHGYGHDAADWAENHLERVAEENDAVTVAMDYPGQSETATWQVREGAEASVAAARALKLRCKPDQTVAYGVSMGANASGIALASANGLFDWWVAVEGAHNLIETYHEASVVAASGNAFANEAKRGIEHDMGGTYQEAPGTYEASTNVLLAEQIRASGIDGVVMVHGVGDGLVPYNQSREMALALAGMPIDFTTVLTRGADRRPETDGTTPDGYAYDAAGVEALELSRFAGHANENSQVHLVGKLGFERLRDLLAGRIDFVVNEHVVDGAATDGQRVP